MARHDRRVGYGLPTLLAIGLHVLVVVLSVVTLPSRESEETSSSVVQATLVSTETTTDQALRAEEARARAAQRQAEEETAQAAAEAAAEAERQEAEEEAQRQADQQEQREAQQQARENERREAEADAQRRAEEAERQARLREEQEAATAERQRQEEEAERQRQEEEAERQRQEEEAERQRQEEEAERQRQEEEAERQRQEEEAERQRQEEAERQRQEEEAERQRQEEAERQRQEEEAERQRQEAARRAAEAASDIDSLIAGEEAAIANARQATQASNSFQNLLRQAVEQAWIIPAGASSGLAAELEIQLLPTGELIGATIVSSSGDGAFDRSVIQAVQRAAPFRELRELPAAAQSQFRQFNLRFRPGDVR